MLASKTQTRITGHDVSTVPEMGWASIQNRALLTLMEPVFDVFLTVDGNLRHQQNLRGRNIALIVLAAPDNTIETLRPLMLQVLTKLVTIQPGQIVRVA